jgi:hypothetical protein
MNLYFYSVKRKIPVSYGFTKIIVISDSKENAARIHPLGVTFDEIKDSPKDSPWNELWVLPEDTIVEELGSVEEIQLNMVISAEFVE